MTGAELRRWRQSVNASMDTIAAELGVHRSTVSRMEQLEQVPRLYHLALTQVAVYWSKPLPEIPQ